MSEPASASAQRSSTWLQRGVATITRMGRAGNPPVSDGSTNRLRDLFSDLMAFVIFFETTCEKQPPSLNDFREKVLALVNAQEERAKANGVAVETFRETRFAVLSWVDETVLNSNWPYRSQWQHLMLSFYRTVNAGEEFFRHLELLPSQANDIREIYYLCLSLGFQGKYAFGDDQHQLRDLKRALYKQLCGTNGDIRQTYHRLYPEAYQKVAAAPQAKPRVKLLWYATALSFPVLLFICYWFLLRHEANQLIALIQKPAIEVPADWAPSLVEELRRKGLRAVDEPEGVRITLESLLFAANSAQLNPQVETKINDIVATVKRYAPERAIAVEGHASKERDLDEERNRRLSRDRAESVREAFIRLGFRSDRVMAQGFGSTRPVALNDTEQGRMQNRRVEIIVVK